MRPTAFGSVSANGAYSQLGGFVGYNLGNIDNCTSYGNVDSQGLGIGGFAGYHVGVNGVIKHCISYGNASSIDDYIGGFVGLAGAVGSIITESFARGDLQKFSWDSAWWVFNFVANFANLKYSHMVKDIQKVQFALENQFISLQPVIDKTALGLHANDPDLLVEYLTNYSVSQGDMVVKRWVELGEFLITKYNDGYVKDDRGRPRSVGYPSEWLKKVLELKPEQFKLPKWGDESKDGRLH